MANGLKLENIKTYFIQHQLPPLDQSSIIYGMINAKAWQYALLSGLATLFIRHMLIYFNAEKNYSHWSNGQRQFIRIHNRYSDDQNYQFELQNRLFQR
ncbi:hypothetical protein [Snodgrassella alvi]|uniref:hypothetical protein n=1 Tax=Snodgrassella alvi TaxID=1196083 RepID=UPI00345F247C